MSTTFLLIEGIIAFVMLVLALTLVFAALDVLTGRDERVHHGDVWEYSDLPEPPERPRRGGWQR